jgi:hypothetical protein
MAAHGVLDPEDISSSRESTNGVQELRRGELNGAR